ncbi:oligosaccharyl transferase, archaeosortase A system-associated [Halorubrum sp. Atlit-8R]|uniref:oligosaccharyl transferase, archaeosortase A system-associated n=1 Tax=unclassified Halorubrum TaxID=2642239 RepID=UPI000EF1A70B|nr:MULTISPECIES: oligosaccharyl transferase, archaeosortase A system-associated [unclassified Halorubrum]RLM70772.1 oligosaccharyl transferase, archaeosortase A system-associated [Halorubrum sp. Atlit-9R]RLM71640.1 oligosaccharyl transferase, archaeosortase A system-associated [Halorubrum sp. Atlit-9R]RLM83075.1 oligosaccharyl transferase, archaeosortase A system-associated [Halorubrum sp. Atlit-8R]
MSDSNDPPAESDSSPSDLLARWYHVPVLLGVVAFMLWTRLRSYGNFIQNGEVYFRGNDAWYHLRTTSYLLENYPSTLPYDVWTGFPVGTNAGQFGTLWDHIMAVGIWIARPIMGSTEEVMLVMSPIIGALVAVPTYFIARRFVDRVPALVGAATLALFSGTFLRYTLVGFPDHSAAEVLFQSTAVLAFLVALGVAEREKPVWELVVDQDWNALRKPITYAAAAGVALGLYMWTWQPGILMVGFTGIFLAVKITSDTYHGKSPEPVAFAGAVAMSVAGLMQIIPLDTLRFASSEYSLLQIVTPIAVALGAVFLAWLARQWEARDLGTDTYPAAVGGLVLASAGFVWLAMPSLWSTVIGNLLNTVAFSASAGARTIGEAQPPLQGASFSNFVFSQYGLAFFLALAAVLYILARPLYRSDDTNHTLYIPPALAVVGSVYAVPQAYGAIGGVIGVDWQVIGLLIAAAFLVGATLLVEYDAEELYFVVWAAFIGSAAFTQVRFNYYLAVVVAVGTAYFLQVALDTLDLTSLDAVREIEGWQVLTVAAVIAILIVPLVGVATPVWQAGNSSQPGSIVQWDESLQWMNDETPQPGELEGADNPMELYGTYERPADGDFEYPEGAYGVQSWWDYGHWITTRAERIPNANPFQQNAGEAADYLLAPSEEEAAEVLASQSTEGNRTRYVMVDWQMASPNSKFNAPVTFYSGNKTVRDFNELLYRQVEGPQGQQGGFRAVLQTRTQRYHESQMIRLYQHYGSAVEPEPVVVDWETRGAQTASGEQIDIRVLPSQGQAIRRFDNLSVARSYVEEDGSAQVGGVMGVPSERLDALEHYRLVHATEAPGRSPYAQQASILAQQFGVDLRATFGESFLGALRDDFVKTFERVPGATVEGSGAAPGQEVQATVELRKPNGQTFEYTQYATADDDGNFEFTLPYSTTGYDEFGPENGYTNTSVRATGPYNVTTAATTDDDLYTTERFGQVEVTEGQVVGADDAAATVELEERIIDCPSGDPECPVDGDSGSDGGDSTKSTDAGSVIGVEPVAATTATAVTAPN